MAKPNADHTSTRRPGLMSVLAGVLCMKLLLVYAYRSTDFEVHRNWLAVTYSLPVDQWYQDNTSQWTLDYPPFFAWIEFGLAKIAVRIDPKMVKLDNQNYSSFSTVTFQRLSVIATDFVMITAAFRLAKIFQRSSVWSRGRSKLAHDWLVLGLVANAGLLLVDSIHFQYNGLLFGILLHSIAAIVNSQYLAGAFLFATLLNMKHIYLYLAPAFGAYLFRNYCFGVESRPTVSTNVSAAKKQAFKRNGSPHINASSVFTNVGRSIGRFLSLGTIVVGVFSLSFGPFYVSGGVKLIWKILARLFPFKRGLTHAYWAPNFWALYNFADFCLAKLLKDFLPKEWAGLLPRFARFSRENPIVFNYTTGLVQEFDHVVLPSVTPLATLIGTTVALLPFFVFVLCVRTPAKTTFVRLITLCGFASFLFGWHVHEKAVLMLIIPQTLLGLQSRPDARILALLSAVGHYSLFPLLFHSNEIVLRNVVFWIWNAIIFGGLRRLYPGSSDGHSRFKFAQLPLLSWGESLYVWGLGVVELAHIALPHLVPKFPFLPLMLVSVYCAVGVGYCWMLVIWQFLEHDVGITQKYYRDYKWPKAQNAKKKQSVLKDTEAWQLKLLQQDLKLGIDRAKPPTGRGDHKRLKLVGGFDMQSLDGDADTVVGVLTVLAYPGLEVLHQESGIFQVSAPYVPGFLAFREMPVLEALMAKLMQSKPTMRPHVLFIDGNGILHPRRFGLACHAGVVLDLPTLGVAKNLHMVENLLKEKRRYEEELISVGQTISLDDAKGKPLGAAVKTAESAKNPVFVSVGHKISLELAVHIVIQCSKYRIPEPTRQADQIARVLVQELEESFRVLGK